MTMRLSHALALAAIALLGLSLVVALQPSQVRVTRIAPVGNSLPIAMDVVRDLGKLPDWAPFVAAGDVEAAADSTRGEASTYAWSGGRATLAEEKPAQVTFDLELKRPRPERFRVIVEFLDRSRVDCSITYLGDPKGFRGKLAGLFEDEETRIGPALEQALKRLAAAIAAEGKRREAERLERAEGAARPSDGASSGMDSAFNAFPGTVAPPPERVDPRTIEAEIRRRERRREQDKGRSTPD